MKGMKVGALILVLFIGSLIPLTAAEGTEDNTTSVSTYSLENSTREQVIATQLVNVLERISKLAEERIEPIKDRLPENSNVLKDYEQAETYKVKALEEYNQRDYYNAILDGLTAMHYYRRALERIEEGREKATRIQARIQAQLERVSTYLGFVRKTIHLAERRGINVENLTRAYNETVKAYGAVLVDLKEKNLTRVVKDLEVLKERKSVLDDELRRVHEKLAYANAKEIVLEFLVRGGEKGIQIAQNAIQAGQERGYNVNRLQENLDEFLTVYGSVKSLANKGEWGGEALKLIQKNRATIGEFYRTVSAVIRGAREEELQEKVKNMKAFLWSFSERAKNDARALQELREKGVNTKRAEVQLRAAVNEVGGVGIYLVRERKPEMARIHFENALNLLKNIEDFIRANS